MKKLRVGIAGVGGGVAALHLAAYRGLEAIELVAGADPDAAALDRVVGAWGIRGYGDVDAMLARERLNVLCVCTPARYHRPVVEQAARHKVHCLVEKPLAVTLEDGRAMIEACARAGVALGYGSSYRSLSAVARAREMIGGGEIGEVSLMIEVATGGNGLAGFADLGPHHYPVGGPGGAGMGLMDHGIHAVDIFRWFMDCEVATVCGRGIYSGGAPVSEHLTMTFETGAVGHVILNTVSRATRLPAEGIFSKGGGWTPDGELVLDGRWDENPISFEVYGATGSLRIFPYAEQLFVFTENGVKPVALESCPMPGNFARQMAGFAASIRDARPPEIAASDGLEALRVVLAAYESNEKQAVISLV